MVDSPVPDSEGPGATIFSGWIHFPWHRGHPPSATIASASSRTRPAHSTFTPSSTAPKPTAEHASNAGRTWLEQGRTACELRSILIRCRAANRTR